MARTSPVTKGANTKLTSTEYNDQLILNLQHLLAYTLDGVDLDTITTPLELHDFSERVAPGTPSSGIISMYVDSADGWLKTKNDAGLINYWGQNFYTRKIALGANGQFTITLADYEEADGATSMIIDYRFRSVTATTSQLLYMQLNGDTPNTKYFRQGGGAADGAALVAEAGDQVIDVIPASTSPANQYQRGQIIIHNLESGDGHVVQVMSAGLYDTGKIRNNLMGFVWNDTSAITSFRLFGAGGSTDLISGSWIKLRFIKEAF